ncbi:DUF2018 family protein [Sulfuricurvum sp. IAE1]|jgi:hypothetical protein|uniref:DUF2018 family protein n=1 Tax=Sulfuricurvum sp. IAE1 TaxID=2546102 RepID=UPI001046AC0A|nr:DUF2018 family protein [Sulfuricurvum sp. IAE1]MDD3769462.1 DUF2018 family protein [Sulfuricurvum sp.]MDX9966491.1 DUF2018 family protein [Sulfuricurvum sp.]TDA67374.1 DUF2018 family protein [Sulfuricurvum sp. IAE1]
MSKYDVLFEDEDDIFGGSPQSKYWDIATQVSEDLYRYDFDEIMTKIAVMEKMLMQQHGEEELDRIVESYAIMNQSEIENHKKSLYMEYAGRLIYKISD